MNKCPKTIRYFSIESLTNFGTRLLESRGVSKNNARRIAKSAVLNEAAGVTTHGICLFPYYDKLVSSSIDPKAKPVVASEKGAVALIDGNRSFAQMAVDMAADIAAKKAKAFGIAAVGVINTSWVAGLGVKLIPLVKKGFFTQMFAGSSFKFVAPFGGSEALMGTNPIAFGFPVHGHPPVISDFSASTIARGRARLISKAGKKAPEKIFLDARGKATENPAVLEKGGTIMLLGGERFGYKGFSLSLWVEALGLMIGNRYEQNRPTGEFFVLTAMDPAAFGQMRSYTKEVKEFVALLKKSKRRPGVKDIRLPGERSSKALAESKKRGVPLSEQTIEGLNLLAVKNGIKAVAER